MEAPIAFTLILVGIVTIIGICVALASAGPKQTLPYSDWTPIPASNDNEVEEVVEPDKPTKPLTKREEMIKEVQDKIDALPRIDHDPYWGIRHNWGSEDYWEEKRSIYKKSRLYKADQKALDKRWVEKQLKWEDEELPVLHIDQGFLMLKDVPWKLSEIVTMSPSTRHGCVFEVLDHSFDRVFVDWASNSYLETSRWVPSGVKVETATKSFIIPSPPYRSQEVIDMILKEIAGDMKEMA